VSTLADTGPLVALIDEGQGEVHLTCVAELASLSGPLLTTWPCFTEAMYFLGDLKGWSGQEALWGFIERGALRIHLPAVTETKRMRVLMEKYFDTPMDLADASLVAAAETQKLHRIFTLDSDFRVYRINGTTGFDVLPQP
jgi:predicted nucleic acid-binding protein